MKMFRNRWIFGIIFLVGVPFVVHKLVRIQTISCSISGGEPCPKLEELSSLKNFPLFFTDFAAVQSITAYAKKNTLDLRSYSIKLPYTLILEFDKNPSSYSLIVNDSNYFTVTKTGAVEELPAPMGKSELKISSEDSLFDNDQRIKPELHAFFSEYILAQEKNTVLSEKLLLQKNHIELRSKSGIHVLLPLERPNEKLRQLDEILHSQAITTLSEPLLEVDLRFDLPVLRTQQ